MSIESTTDEQRDSVAVQRLVRLWEPLGPLQPFLEFFDGARWVPSGITTGTCSRAFVGRYRVSKPNEKTVPTEGGENQHG